MASIDCEGKSTREINARLKELATAGERAIELLHPAARHNLAVALLVECAGAPPGRLPAPVTVTIHGSVGYYCGGLGDGATIHVQGSAGWGLAESQMSGTVIVEGHAGNGAAASIRGGQVVVKGDAAARAGIALKGGALIVGGSAGSMSGFMMQKGTLVICGDAGAGLGDSIYAGQIFVGGAIAGLGSDAVEAELTAADQALLAELLAPHELGPRDRFRKIVSGGRLHHFDKHEIDLWKTAL
jgi:glutamate synthase domain-containing protein 3